MVLNFGRKIYDGSTRTVQDDPAVLEAYLGTRQAEKVRTHAEADHVA